MSMVLRCRIVKFLISICNNDRKGRQRLVQTDFRRKEMTKQNKNNKTNPIPWFKKAQHSTQFQRQTTKSTSNLKLREVKNQTLWAAHARLTQPSQPYPATRGTSIFLYKTYLERSTGLWSQGIPTPDCTASEMLSPTSRKLLTHMAK